MAASRRAPRFPRLYAAASLKHLVELGARDERRGGFPRLYAAASLKREIHERAMVAAWWFSAALCRGLIEAGRAGRSGHGSFSVFRGFMPRPH